MLAKLGGLARGRLGTFIHQAFFDLGGSQNHVDLIV